MTTIAKEYIPSTWDLSELVGEPVASEMNAKLAALEEGVQAFEAKRDLLLTEMDPEELLDIVEQYEALVEQIYIPYAFASLSFSEDTQSGEALNMLNRIQQVVTEAQNRVLFFSLWWKELDDETAARLMPAGEALADYRHYLEDLRRTKPYTLDEKSEQIINTKDANGVGALITVYSMLTNRLEFTLEIDGEEQTLTRDALMANVQGPESGFARSGLPGTLSGLRARGQHPGPDLCQSRARLDQRECAAA